MTLLRERKGGKYYGISVKPTDILSKSRQSDPCFRPFDRRFVVSVFHPGAASVWKFYCDSVVVADTLCSVGFAPCFKQRES